MEESALLDWEAMMGVGANGQRQVLSLAGKAKVMHPQGMRG